MVVLENKCWLSFMSFREMWKNLEQMLSIWNTIKFKKKIIKNRAADSTNKTGK